MYEYKEKGQLATVIGDILGEKYIRSLVLIAAAIFIPILVSNEIFGNMTLRLLELLGSGTIVLSTILIYTSLKLSPNTEAAEYLWENIFVYCFFLGGLSLVLTVSIYLSAMISVTMFWSILIGALMAGGVWGIGR
jgi:hypothetical protein